MGKSSELVRFSREAEKQGALEKAPPGGLAKALQGELAIKIPIRQGIQDSEFLIQEISNEVLWQRRSGE